MIDRSALLRLTAPILGRFTWFSYPFAALVGWATWHTRPGRRRTVIQNMLPLCDGDRARAAREGKLALRNIARYWVDVMTIPHRDMANFEAKHITLIDGDWLKALEAPGPVLLVSAHMGSPELPLQAITFRGRQFTALVEDVQPPAFGRHLLRLRMAAGGRYRVAGFGGVRACVEALKQGDVVGMLADRDLQGSGMCAMVSGRHVRLPRGPWEMARRTNATVIPVFMSRNWRDHFTVRVEEPFQVPCSGDEEADVRGAVDRWAGLLDAHLRREPGQWTVLESFWRAHRCG
jgi:phosphatidylinositol dimannoside acyltransferase